MRLRLKILLLFSVTSVCGLCFARPNADGSQTFYVYDATGLKLRTVHDVAQLPVAMPAVGSSSSVRRSVTDYCGLYVYEDSLLSRINLEGGYLSYTDNAGNRLSDPEYHYYLTDHLGNNRMDVTDDGGVEQAMDYYPFGMPMGSSYLPGAQRWLFGGKELDRTSGLDLYDQEARAYDPALGRFRNPDPLAGNYTSLSPYLFCAANPLLLIDPDGKDALISILGNKITVTANIILKGQYANSNLAQIYYKDIQNTWGQITKYTYEGKEYDVVWNVSVRVMKENEKKDYNGSNNYMTVMNFYNRSSVSGTNHGQIRNKGNFGSPLSSDCPMSHEFGHFLGLKDQYTKKTNGEYVSNPGFENDIMGTAVNKKNRVITDATRDALFQPALNKSKQIKRVYKINLYFFKFTIELPYIYQINEKNKQK